MERRIFQKNCWNGPWKWDFFFLTPKRRVLGKNDQAQKVLKIVSLPPIKGKNFDFSKKKSNFLSLTMSLRISHEFRL